MSWLESNKQLRILMSRAHWLPPTRPRADVTQLSNMGCPVWMVRFSQPWPINWARLLSMLLPTPKPWACTVWRRQPSTCLQNRRLIGNEVMGELNKASLCFKTSPFTIQLLHRNTVPQGRLVHCQHHSLCKTPTLSDRGTQTREWNPWGEENHWFAYVSILQMSGISTSKQGKRCSQWLRNWPYLFIQQVTESIWPRPASKFLAISTTPCCFRIIYPFVGEKLKRTCSLVVRW